MRASTSSQRQAQTAAWVSAAVNVLLMLGKGVIGITAGSEALFADAVHSAADVVGSLAVIVGLRIARKPPDEDHPYGHGKAELITTALVALLLIGAGVEVAYTSLHALFLPARAPALIAAIAAFLSIFIKEVMFQYTYRLGRRMNSASLVASAYDHRSDVFSSIAALIGILLSDLGSAVHVQWLKHMDAVAGALVALLVLRIGYGLLRDSSQTLMDRTAPDKDLAGYALCVSQTSGVMRLDDLRVRDHGQYVILDVEVSVDAAISVAEGHSIASQVKTNLQAQFSRVADALVHVNPYENEDDEAVEEVGTSRTKGGEE
ncbi:cation diffusion facilitator family transporter [Alicyclobacillus sp. ALC3]|uniref:cation diffusion facilitator family transporter n=1 Tax=Alicyclobacillus sp. ALC3 TaxID=2796143 RepID=UPI002379E0B6|nr:cation diffusion facilitator family transporter [Alicyclobacillus sp. ALC3]WDL96190.1 cation transporter [Alicyclobacillus sp. ALC3]